MPLLPCCIAQGPFQLIRSPLFEVCTFRVSSPSPLLFLVSLTYSPHSPQAFPWDEGSCSAPQALRPSILVSSWGNTESAHAGSTSAYPADNWQHMPADVRGSPPCFDASKDIVMPAFKPPNEMHLFARLWSRWGTGRR